MAKLLELRDFHYYYGNIHAIKGIDLYVDEGEIVTIIGANGAGKSTTLKTISGLTEAKGVRGEILLNGENIAGMGGHKIAAKGIMQVLEGRLPFSTPSVLLRAWALCRCWKAVMCSLSCLSMRI